MKLSSLLAVNAVLAAIFGIAFLVAPAGFLALYGLTVTPGTALVARLFGAALVGYGVLTWRVRGAVPSDALRAVVFALFVGDVLGFLAALHGQLVGAVNTLGWSTVVIYGALAVGFGYFLPRAGSAAAA